MQEVAREAIAYLQASPILNLVIAFTSGLAATRTVAYERRGNWLMALIVGVLGFFLARFVIINFGLIGYFDKLPGFRILLDFLSAYAGSFVVATLIHFIKPL